MGRDDSTSWLLTFGGGSSSGRVIVDVDAELREDGVGPAMDWPGRRRRTPSRMRKLWSGEVTQSWPLLAAEQLIALINVTEVNMTMARCTFTATYN